MAKPAARLAALIANVRVCPAAEFGVRVRDGLRADRLPEGLGGVPEATPGPEGGADAAATGGPRGGDLEGALLRLPLDCAFDAAWSRNAEGRMVCDEDAEDRLAEEYARRHGCTVQLLLREGPAGGNPLYCFFGTMAQLRSLAEEHDGGNGEVDFLLEAAAPLNTPVPELEQLRNHAPSVAEMERIGEAAEARLEAIGA